MSSKDLQELYRLLDIASEVEYVYWDEMNEQFRIVHTQYDEKLGFVPIKLSFDNDESVHKRIEKLIKKAFAAKGEQL